MLGLYIHIPFCRQKCFYCDFFSVNYKEELADKYIKSVVKHSSSYKNVKPDTVYIGGGTPSVLNEEQIKILLSGISSNFNLSYLKEFTFEANPESLTENKLKILKDYGVDRLSLGLQSCDDNHLAQLGRIHDFKTFKKAFFMSREEGFKNINIDLIYGFPNQNLSNLRDDLSEMLELKSEHISLYPLTVEENTVFFKNGVETNSDLQREMYERAAENLQKSGYVHYEISNWSFKGKESLHNGNYWRSCEYIALGAGASGYYNRVRYKNISDIEKYCRHCGLEPQSGIIAEKEYITDELYETETIMLGLRLLNEGVDIEKFTGWKNVSVLNRFLNDKILINDDGKIKLSENSVYVSNQVISEFM
ncbi:MAG: radical SAM family heme chaperone HemW [Endomicrobia bacterium]|nr:radical SAM family heme chaperone HemW [Endomicrobiia bacterium]MCL2799948.1 radical SAM family heme chaperone HemW [Endomicrobiia bacterium]